MYRTRFSAEVQKDEGPDATRSGYRRREFSCAIFPDQGRQLLTQPFEVYSEPDSADFQHHEHHRGATQGYRRFIFVYRTLVHDCATGRPHQI